jgi:uncharacterized membrane protein YhaH (DUF805 family)
MNLQGRISRSRGVVCGLLLILLGAWGGLAPFVGPYFHLGYTPDATWHYNSARLYYSIIPGAAVLLGGLMVTVTRLRTVGMTGSVLAVLGGVWFVGGIHFVSDVLHKSIPVGTALVRGGVSLPTWTYVDSLALFVGLGAVVLFLGGLSIGRFSMVSAKDAAAEAEAEGYYPSFVPAETAREPESAEFPSPTGQFPSVGR